MPKKKDLTGQKFGHLTVLKEALPHKQSKRTVKTKWECQCKCGKIVEIQTSNLTRSYGNTTSCGCSVNITHGLTNHRLYHTWQAMNNRCNNPNDPNYKRYGAKGVYVCERWHIDNPNGFQNFIDDMYPSYQEGYDLDKDKLAIPNQPKVYSPSTCCWLTHVENMKYRSSKKLTPSDIKYIKQQLNNGITHRNIAEQFNVSRRMISHINTGRNWKDI